MSWKMSRLRAWVNVGKVFLSCGKIAGLLFRILTLACEVYRTGITGVIWVGDNEKQERKS